MLYQNFGEEFKMRLGTAQNGEKQGLLDELARRSGCLYLSDLRGADYRTELRKALFEIPEDQFQLEEWNEAAFYLLGIKDRFHTPGDAGRGIHSALRSSSR